MTKSQIKGGGGPALNLYLNFRSGSWRMQLLVQNCLDPSRATEIFSVPKRWMFASPKIVRYRNISGLQYTKHGTIITHTQSMTQSLIHKAWHNRSYTKHDTITHTQSMTQSSLIHKAWHNHSYTKHDTIITHTQSMAQSSLIHKAWHNQSYTQSMTQSLVHKA